METQYLTIDSLGHHNYFDTKQQVLDFLIEEREIYFDVEEQDFWDYYCPTIYKEISINEFKNKC